MRRAWALLSSILCLGVCAAAGGATVSSGIEGRIVEAPTCPVERVPPDPQCAPRPLSARLRVRSTRHGSRPEVVRSGSDGRFRVRLAAGTYVVTPLARPGSPFPRPPAPSHVQVRRGRFTHITITYDSGIR